MCNKAVMRRFVFAGLSLIAFFAPYFESSRSVIGVSLSGAPGNYHFEAGSNPISIITSMLLICGFTWNLLSPLKPGATKVPASVLYRVISFLIDFVWAITMAAPLIALWPLLVEAGITGRFSWVIHRNFLRASDIWIMAITMVLLLGWLMFYFVASNYKANQTPGAVIIGIKIEYTGENPTIGRTIDRALVGIASLFIWFGSLPSALRDAEK